MQLAMQRRDEDQGPPEQAHYVRIVPSRGWVAVPWRELWDYRELLFFLAWRDVKVRYKQTLLGTAWAVIVPLMTMIVFNLLFGVLMGAGNRPTIEGVPYAISTFAALVPWQLFAYTMGQSGNSLVANRNMITKVYFPRLVAPLAPILSGLVDFLIAFAVLAAMIVGFHLFTDYHFEPSWRLLALPVFTALAVLTAVAMSLWLSAMNAIYRDVRYVIPFLIQTLMFVSPVVYTTSNVIGPDTPAWIATLYGLNPLAGVIEGFRWSLFGRPELPWLMVLSSAAGVMLLMIGGGYYFRRMERLFADLA
jgi:lipopolysaccharide transport system permease protein